MAIVNKDLCIPCGACYTTHDKLFVLGGDGKAEAMVEPTPENISEFQEAQGECLAGAIHVEAPTA